MDDSPSFSPPSGLAPPPASGGPNANPTPKTIGILNIIFGSLLLAFGCLCYGPGMLLFFLAFPAMLDGSKQIMEQGMQQQQARIDQLQEEFDQSEDEQEQAQLQAQIDALKRAKAQLAQNPATAMDTTALKEIRGNPIVTGYFLADIVSGVLLNLLMLIAGMKLTKYKAAGHKLSMRVFPLKIIRLVLLQGVYIAFVMPQWMEMSKAFVASQPNNPMVQYSADSTASGIVMGVLTTVIGCVYPIVALWVLSRPHNKAACNQP